MIRKLGLLLLGVSLNQSVSASFAELLKRQIQASLEANAAGQKSNFSAPILLDKFYESRSFEPAWLDPEGPIPEVNDLLIALRQADREGLTPSDYQLSLIQDMLDAFQVARSSLNSVWRNTKGFRSPLAPLGEGFMGSIQIS